MATDPDRPDDDPADGGPDDPSSAGSDSSPDSGSTGGPATPANPLEALLGALGGTPPGTPGGPGALGGAGGPGGPGGLDLSALFAQMQQWLTPHEGAVNWDLAKKVARHVVAQQSDPTPTANQQQAVRDAVRLADLWLDGATDLPTGVAVAAAWSRAEWVESTQPEWATVVEPVAEHVAAAMGEAMPAEVRQMAGPLIGLLAQAGGAMFGQQLGQALGALAGEVLSGTDIGLPLAPAGTAAVVPANVAAFGEGLGLEQRDVLLYVALRECAHHRLFEHVPWLRGHLSGAVNAYARGTRLDVAAIEETVRGIDPTDPAALQSALSEGLFEPRSTPEQDAALDRLETSLALVEGWVDEVVAQATHERLPSAPALREAMRRRRASGGPAEQTFASLVGLELRPRRLRDAATLWSALRDRSGAEARDALWRHPDLLPSSADLDDPLGFVQGERADGSTVTAASEEEFDAALRALLDDDAAGPDEPGR